MNNEIKEILEKLEWYRKIGKKDVYYPECVLPNKKAFILLDYITDLQQENERLKAKYDNNKSHEINYKYFTTLYSKATKDIVIDDLVYKCEDLDNLKKSYEKLYIEKEDYKTRCEKAIEYVKKHYPTATINDQDDKYDLLNILQNGSDDNE